MFSRMLTPPILVAAAVGVPYVATNSPDIDISKYWSTSTASAPAEQPVEEQPVATSVAPLQSRVTTVPLQEALSLSVTKEWVYSRWDRKSTALSELGLYGVRVSLVSGTQLYDVAGSLTYYFGRDGRVYRISLRGRTADTSQIIAIAQRYGLQPQPTAIVGEQLMQIRREGLVYSELRTRPETVLNSESLHQSFLVNLELQRPDAISPLSAQLPAPVKLPAPPQPAPTVEANSEEKEPAKSVEEALIPYFPRSRVPAEQVENLERLDRYR